MSAAAQAVCPPFCTRLRVSWGGMRPAAAGCRGRPRSVTGGWSWPKTRGPCRQKARR